MNIFPQRQLDDMKQSSQLRIQQREKEAHELRQAIFSLTVSTNTQFGLLDRWYKCLTSFRIL